MQGAGGPLDYPLPAAQATALTRLCLAPRRPIFLLLTQECAAR
jgi:hypothetical protein